MFNLIITIDNKGRIISNFIGDGEKSFPFQIEWN